MIDTILPNGASLGDGARLGPMAFVGRDASVVGSCVEGKIGARTKVWRYAHVMYGAEIGNDCMIGQGVFVADGVRIGNKVKIQNHTDVSRNVTIEDEVYIGAGVRFCNSRHPLATEQDKLQPITVKRGASIGSNVCILGGVTIGEHAVIGAGAVVTKDVESGMKAIGVPARSTNVMDEQHSGTAGGEGAG